MANKLVGLWRDQHAIRRTGSLYSRGKARKLAERFVSVSAGRTFDIADNDVAGSDANVKPKPFRCLAGNRLDGLDHLKACERGALRVVFVGFRPAEMGGEAITEVFRDAAPEACDDAAADFMERVQELGQIFLIEVPGE